jgi:type I restriction enzyme S subunit
MDAPPWSVPLTWRWCRFDEIARVASNLVSPADFQTWPHIAPNHIESGTGRLLPYDTIAHDRVTSAKHRFSAGQVLYSKIRPYLAKVVVADFDGLCSADMYPIESELDPRFLKWWMLTREFTRRAAGEQARTVLPKINVRALSGLPVPVPPLTEQRRIVEILEDHLSRLDAAYSLLSTAQARLEIYQASVRDVAVTGGAGRVRVGANLPIGWRWASVEEFAAPTKGSMTIGPFGSNLKVVDYREFGVPLVFVRNVRTASFGPVGCRYVTPEKAKELRAHRVEPGDVVVTKMGDPPGHAAVYRADGPGVVTADVIRIQPAVGVDPDYLALALNSGLVRQQIADITRGVAQQKVSLARYRSEVLVPTPAFDVQAAVATACAEDLAAASRAETAIKALEVKLSALRRTLLAAAFSGRLAS